VRHTSACSAKAPVSMLAQIRMPGASGASPPAAVIVPTTSTPGVKGSAGLRW